MSYLLRDSFEPSRIDSWHGLSAEDFVRGVYYSLEYWLATHDDAVAWATHMMRDSDGEDFLALHAVMENDYYYYNLRDSFVDQWCRDHHNSFGRCKRCGMISEIYCNYQCDNECFCDAKNDSEIPCTCPESILEDVDAEELADDMYEQYGNDIPEFMSVDSDDVVFNLLVDEGFDAYFQGVNPVTYEIKQTVRDAMRRLYNAESTQDQFVTALAMTHLEHHSGVILEDYGDYVGLDFDLVDLINNEGPESVIDSEDIDQFLEDAPIAFDDYYIVNGRSLRND